MDGIQFADGFDAPDRLAFGLGAAQLVAVIAGGIVAFGLLHAPLPSFLAVPLAATAALAGALLGWMRFAGRPALDWALFAARHALRAREGTLLVEWAAGAGQRGEARAGNVIPLRVAGAPARGAPSALTFRDRPPAVAAAAQPVDPRPPAVRPGAGRLRVGGAHRIVFFSLKGGTGRTTLATELAAAFAARAPGGDVFLLDLDVRSACVGARLGLVRPGIVEYALAPPEERRVSEFAVRHSSGVHVMLGPTQPASPDWPVNPPVLREALRELDMDGAALVVMDVSPQLTALTRAALNAADDVIVLLVPTASGVQDAYRTTEQLRHLGLRHRLRYVVNRARGSVDVSVAMADLGGELIAEIPDDQAIIDAENAHEPAAPAGDGGAAREVRRLARRLLRDLESVAAR